MNVIIGAFGALFPSLILGILIAIIRNKDTFSWLLVGMLGLSILSLIYIACYLVDLFLDNIYLGNDKLKYRRLMGCCSITYKDIGVVNIAPAMLFGGNCWIPGFRVSVVDRVSGRSIINFKSMFSRVFPFIYLLLKQVGANTEIAYKKQKLSVDKLTMVLQQELSESERLDSMLSLSELECTDALYELLNSCTIPSLVKK